MRLCSRVCGRVDACTSEHAFPTRTRRAFSRFGNSCEDATRGVIKYSNQRRPVIVENAPQSQGAEAADSLFSLNYDEETCCAEGEAPPERRGRIAPRGGAGTAGLHAESPSWKEARFQGANGMHGACLAFPFFAVTGGSYVCRVPRGLRAPPLRPSSARTLFSYLCDSFVHWKREAGSDPVCEGGFSSVFHWPFNSRRVRRTAPGPG